MTEIQDLCQKILLQERRSIAQAITLVESSRQDHRIDALTLLEHLSKSNRQALRIGLSGAPGVGKSTFIESFGLMLIEEGLSVAVLAVDPSSTRSGGSILGDKTRMEKLSRSPQAFIRPSPSLSHLGGVARRTREAISVCEAANFNIIIIETVGVGQSETMVSEMTDLFLLLLAPAGGDELQGVKRGIMEIADLIVVNKADGELKAAAVRTQSDYAGALHLLRRRAQDPKGFPKASQASSISGIGLDHIWKDIKFLTEWRKSNGWWKKRRKAQSVHWFESEIRNQLLSVLSDESAVEEEMEKFSKLVSEGNLSPEAAAEKFVAWLKT